MIPSIESFRDGYNLLINILLLLFLLIYIRRALSQKIIELHLEGGCYLYQLFKVKKIVHIHFKIYGDIFYFEISFYAWTALVISWHET